MTLEENINRGIAVLRSIQKTGRVIAGDDGVTVEVDVAEVPAPIEPTPPAAAVPLIAITGQSQMLYLLDGADQGTEAVAPQFPYATVYGGFNPPAYTIDAVLRENNHSEGLNAFVNAYSEAVNITGYAKGATPIAEWQTPTSPAYVELKAVLDQVGAFTDFIFMQGTHDGHSGGLNGNGAAYKQAFKDFETQLRLDFPHEFTMHIVPLGRVLDLVQSKAYNIRMAHYELTQELDNCALTPIGADIEQEDAYHQTKKGNIRLGARLAHYLKTGNAGAKILHVQHPANTDVLMITFDKQLINGATGLPENLSIHINGTTTDVAIGAVAVDGQTLTVQLLDPYPQGGIAVRPYYGVTQNGNTDIGMENTLRDNDIVAGDIMGMPIAMQPTVISVVV